MTRPGFPIPPDKIESGCGFRGWVDCVFYGETILEVAGKKGDYFNSYPPQGYSTHTIGDINLHPDGYYYIKIRRWSSCD